MRRVRIDARPVGCCQGGTCTNKSKITTSGSKVRENEKTDRRTMIALRYTREKEHNLISAAARQWFFLGCVQVEWPAEGIWRSPVARQTKVREPLGFGVELENVDTIQSLAADSVEKRRRNEEAEEVGRRRTGSVAAVDIGGRGLEYDVAISLSSIK